MFLTWLRNIMRIIFPLPSCESAGYLKRNILLQITNVKLMRT